MTSLIAYLEIDLKVSVKREFQRGIKMGREKDDFFLHQSTKNSSSSKVQRAPGEAEGFQYVFPF